MHDELLDIAIKNSPMPRKSATKENIRATMDIVYLSKEMKPDHKEEVFNVLISCVKIYGDPDLIKKEMLNDETS